MSAYEIVDGVYKGPEPLREDLLLACCEVKDLGNLRSVVGNLSLENTGVVSLGLLEYVDGWLDISGTKIRSLAGLDYVGDTLYLPDGTEVRHFESYKEEAKLFLEEVKIVDYPLHMNHENFIVRSEINNYLETLI
jgi:hypothetical protein